MIRTITCLCMALLKINNLKSKIKAKLYLMSVMIVKNTHEKGTYNHILFQTHDWTEEISSLELVTSTPISVENYHA